MTQFIIGGPPLSFLLVPPTFLRRQSAMDAILESLAQSWEGNAKQLACLTELCLESHGLKAFQKTFYWGPLSADSLMVIVSISLPISSFNDHYEDFEIGKSHLAYVGARSVQRVVSKSSLKSCQIFPNPEAIWNTNSQHFKVGFSMYSVLFPFSNKAFTMINYSSYSNIQPFHDNSTIINPIGHYDNSPLW